MLTPPVILLLPWSSQQPLTRGCSYASCHYSRSTAQAPIGVDAESPNVRDAQLDPEQHRRRPAYGAVTAPLPEIQPAQLHMGPPKQSHGQQLPPARDGAPESRLRCSTRTRPAAEDLLSAPGDPEPGTVQDQSSCALLMLPTRLPDHSGPAWTCPQFELAVGAAQAGEDGGADVSTCSGMEGGPDEDFAAEDCSGRAVCARAQPPSSPGVGSALQPGGASVAARAVVNTPWAAATAAAPFRAARCGHAVLDPLCDGPDWLPPGESGFRAIAGLKSSRSSRRRAHHWPAAVATAQVAPASRPKMASPSPAAAAAAAGQVERGDEDLGSNGGGTMAGAATRRCHSVVLWPAGIAKGCRRASARADGARAGLSGSAAAGVTAFGAVRAAPPPALGRSISRIKAPAAEGVGVLARVELHNGRRTAEAAKAGVRGFVPPATSAFGGATAAATAAAAPPSTPFATADTDAAAAAHVAPLPLYDTVAVRPAATTATAGRRTSNDSSTCSSRSDPVLLPGPTRTSPAPAAASKTAVRLGRAPVYMKGCYSAAGLESSARKQMPDPRVQSLPFLGVGDDSAGRQHSIAVADGRWLMCAIKGCRRWRELRAVQTEHGSGFNALHVTAALGKLTRMHLPQPSSGDARHARDAAEVQALLSDLETAFRRHLLSTAARAAAHGARRGGTDPRAAASAATRDGSCISTSDRGSDDSDTVRKGRGSPEIRTAVGTLTVITRATQPQPQDVHGACPSCTELGPRQMATGLAAMARLRDAGWVVVQEPELQRTAAAVSLCWGLDRFPPQELTTLLYALAKMGHHPGRRWLEAACGCAAAAAAERRMCPRQLSTFLWALARLRHQPGQAFAAAWLKAAVQAMARFSAYDISQALWALATLHRARSPPLQPPAPAAAATAAAVAAAGPHGLPEVFVSAALGRAKAALRPRDAGSGGGGSCYAPQDVCNTLWAVSQLQLRPTRAWVASVASALLSAPNAAIARCRPVDLAGLMWALARLTTASPPPPPRGEMLRIVRAVARQAGQCGEQDLGNVLWALGALRFAPPPAVMRALGLRLLGLVAQDAAGPQLLSAALWCCLRLRLPPQPALLRPLLAAAARRAPEFDARSAPLLLYSLARLHHCGWLYPDAVLQPGLPSRQPVQPTDVQLHGCAQRHASSSAATTGTVGRAEAEARAAMDLRSGGWADGPAAAAPAPAAKGAVAARCAANSVAVAAVQQQQRDLDLGPFLEAALRGIAEVGEAELEEVAGGPPRLALPVLLWSVARLGRPPEESWTRAVLAHSFEVLPQLSPLEACVVVSALLRLRHLPPALWLARMEHLTACRWGPAAAVEKAQLQRAMRAVHRRLRAVAGVATPPAVPPTARRTPSRARAQTLSLLMHPDDAKTGCAAVEVGVTPSWQSSAGTPLMHHDREWWRERQRQRRREVAAKVLLRRLAGCRARARQLTSSMARLRRGLNCLRDRVEQQLQEAGASS